MLMAASWPSNREAAVTNRSGLPGSGGFMLLAGKMGYPRVTRAVIRRRCPAAPAKPRPASGPKAAHRPARRGPRAAGPAGHALKRDAVILAAARAFRERGYHNTSLDDLAASLEVTKPTLYLYVPNKEAILFECFRAGLAQIQVDAHGVRKRARRRARAAVRVHPRLRRRDCRRLRMVHAARRGPAPRRRDEPPHQTTEGGHRQAHARAHRRRAWPTVRSAPATRA